jgi:hypothetical protein
MQHQRQTPAHSKVVDAERGAEEPFYAAVDNKQGLLPYCPINFCRHVGKEDPTKWLGESTMSLGLMMSGMC